jgi:hypothetical protein
MTVLAAVSRHDILFILMFMFLLVLSVVSEMGEVTIYEHSFPETLSNPISFIPGWSLCYCVIDLYLPIITFVSRVLDTGSHG